jgi:hypothetical protein
MKCNKFEVITNHSTASFILESFPHKVIFPSMIKGNQKDINDLNVMIMMIVMVVMVMMVMSR